MRSATFSAVLASVVLASTSSTAQVSTVGDLYVVQDPSGSITNLVASMMPGSIFPPPQEQFCRAAFNAIRASGAPDDFDGVFAFSTSDQITDLSNVWMGPAVRSAATGIGRDGVFPSVNTYNSTKLGQCVYMGALGTTKGFIPGLPGSEPIPADPDADWSPSLGVPLPGVTSLTGIEMMGHEYGHHWLLGIEFDQADGRGKQHFIRALTGDNPEGGQMGHPNQHYSRLTDSRSVMYGECITDLGGGSFKLQGCPRKYSHIDQYLMGLRGENEVSPMMVLEDPAAPGQGVDSLPMSRTSSGQTVSGLVRHDITAAEIIRAMGPRVPAYPNAQRCWKVAFIVVLAPGQTAVPAAMLTKVQKYQQRWGPWFNMATDGRGTMLTSLTGPGCPTPDGGVVVEPDAGVVEPDAGMAEEDAGVVDPPDAGGGEVITPTPDAGTTKGPTKEETRVDIGTTKLRPGCSCGAAEGLVLAALVGLLARRRRVRAPARP